MIELQVKKLHRLAKIPKYVYTGDVGFDLSSILDYRIVYDQVVMVRTGIAIKIPSYHEMTVRQRSGLSRKYPNYIAIGIGTIDTSYIGEIMIPIVNNNKHEDFIIKIGDRVAQGVISPVFVSKIIEVDELESTERGSQGFGSTGL